MSFVKKIRYLLEALIVRFGLFVFGVMSPKTASNVAAAISKFVGKKISVHHLANENMRKALPHLTSQDREEILSDMWDNLGRIVGEYPHVTKTSVNEVEKLIEISSESRAVIESLKKEKKGGIIFSAHIGNWEIGPKFFLASGLKVSTVYRPLNNPYVEKMTARLRGVPMIEKGASGSRKIIENIKKGEFVIILADQKVSEGELVKFFHDDAVTTTSIARLALRYDIALIPARSIRLGKEFKFRVEVEKPLALKRSDDVNFDAISLTAQINQCLERWISQYPAQWFWVHNRWKR